MRLIELTRHDESLVYIKVEAIIALGTCLIGGVAHTEIITTGQAFAVKENCYEILSTIGMQMSNEPPDISMLES